MKNYLLFIKIFSKKFLKKKLNLSYEFKNNPALDFLKIVYALFPWLVPQQLTSKSCYLRDADNLMIYSNKEIGRVIIESMLNADKKVRKKLTKKVKNKF